MGKPIGPKKVHRYSIEFKLTAVKLSHMPGVQVQTVAEALESIPSCCRAGGRRLATALRHRLPSVSPYREGADAGGLIAYGVSLSGTWRHAAQYVDKILKGARPGELPIEQPNTFELVINLKTAAALGLAVPQALSMRADQLLQ